MEVAHVALAQPAVSEDSLLAVEYLRNAILSGHINGFAWIALGPGGCYEIDVAGWAKEVPVVVRGLMPELDEQLAKLIKAR